MSVGPVSMAPTQLGSFLISSMRLPSGRRVSETSRAETHAGRIFLDCFGVVFAHEADGAAQLNLK